MPAPRSFGALSPAAWLGVIVAFGALVRLLLASHLWGTDDLNYAYAAWIESNHWFSLPDDGHVQTHHDLRKGLILPVAALYALFGVSDWTTGAFSFACSLGLVVLAHRFGRLLLKSEPAALLTAFFAATFPLDIIFASVLWPTEPQALFMSLGVYIFLKAEQAPRGRPLTYLLAGLVIGLAYLVHITALFLVFFFILYFVFWPRRIRLPVFLVGVGVVAVIGLESLAYYPFHGEWLYPIKQVDRSQNMGLGWGYIRNWEGTSALVQGTAWGESFWLGPWVMLLINQEFAAYYIVGLPALVYAAWRAPALRPAIVWFVAVFLWTAYGTTTPARWMWLGRMPRYYAPISIPMLLALAYVVTHLWARGRTRLAVLLAGGIAGTGLLGAALDDGSNTLPVKGLVERVRANPGAGWATDHQTYSQARYYNGFAPLPEVVVLTRPPEPAGPYQGATIRPFDASGVRRFFHYPDNWDLSIRQPENCGSEDKTGALRADCPAERVLAELVGWPVAEAVDAPVRRWLCAPLEWVGGGPAAAVHARLCRPNRAVVHARP